jgi:flavin reductase (DIM6/NTAB) family NADH-FMN oxidoreductase RutF
MNAEMELAMAKFVTRKPTEICDNVFSEIGTRWMLLTAYDEVNERVNAMTASWGAMGVLWNRPVLIAFVRPQRYTYGLLEASDVCSACFLNGQREALKICGTKSGRDTDKISESGLTPVELDGIWGFAEAGRVMKLRKLFVSDMKKENFLDPALLSNYPSEDYHRVYVYEIETVFEQE